MYNDGKIEYIELIQGAFNETSAVIVDTDLTTETTIIPLRKERYTIYKDSIKMEFGGLTVPQEGYALYLFENELLNREIIYVRCTTTAYCIFSETLYEYWHRTHIPKYVYNYYYMKEYAGCGKNFKEKYDKNGNFIEKNEIE